jgi:hypothetical protein
MVIAALLAGADFRAMSEEQLREWIEERLRGYAAEFPELVERLRQVLIQTDPVHVLAMLDLHMARPRGSDAEVEELFPIIQPHVEFLQALILQQPIEAYAWDNPNTVAYLDEIESILKRLSLLFSMKQWAPEAKSRASSIAEMIDRTRGQTQFVRNWGYPEQIQRLVSGVFAPLEERIFEVLGVRVADLVVMINAIMDTGEARLQGLTHQIGRILAAPTKEQALALARELTPEKATEAFAKRILSPAYTLAAAKGDIVEWFPSELAFNLTFTPVHFANRYPGAVDADALKLILDHWAMRFGALRDADAEFFLLDNPVWTHPLIALTDRLYFLPIPPLLNTWCMELMESVIRPYPALLRDYEGRYRGEFLEVETERLFRSALPEAEIHRGVAWIDPRTGTRYETDLLVLLDSGAIVVEAKSGRIGDKARRGAEYSLRDAIDELVVAPATQANRFREFLRDHPGPHTLPTKSGSEVTVDGAALAWTTALTVTLEWNAIHRRRWLNLREEGLVPPDLDPVPVLGVADLECVFQLLNGSCERVQYLRRRAEIEVVPGYAGTELDLLAFYLEDGFADRAAARQPWPRGLDGHFKIIDGYLRNWFARRPAPKPRRRLTKTWTRVIQWLEREQPCGWLEIGCTLLDLNLAEQEHLEHEWNRQADIVRAPRRRLKQQYFVHTGDPRTRNNGSSAIVCVSHKPLSSGELEHLLEATARRVAAGSRARAVIVLSRDVDDRRSSVSSAVILGSRSMGNG